MTFKELCQELGVDENRGHYYRILLKKHGLVNPRRAGNRDIYGEEDVAQFKKLHEYLSDGAQTATEAIRLMEGGMTPGEALAKYQRAQRQIEVLQNKVLQLRKPVWKRLIDWFKDLLAGILSPRIER